MRNMPVSQTTVKLPPRRWVMVTLVPAGSTAGSPAGMTVACTSRARTRSWGLGVWRWPVVSSLMFRLGGI